EEAEADEQYRNQARQQANEHPADAPVRTYFGENHRETDLAEATDRNAAWRAELRRSTSPKERMQTIRVRMTELDAAYRITTRLEEVNQGLSEQQALTEARRCLDCANPGCVQGCPVSIRIPDFVKNVERGQYVTAAQIIKQSSTLPAVCGRVCPQEKQCEAQCIHLKSGHEPVAIGYLERFVADYERESGQMTIPQCRQANGKRIAVVGSGPAGLAFAGDMAREGYEVTVFEALHEIGGVLKYGIPEFRLPNRIVDAEIEGLRRMGVRFMCDTIIGKTITFEQLQAEGYHAVFVGSGAGLPRFMDIKGENLNGVMSSNEYLTRVNLMNAASEMSDTPVQHGRRVAVIGGGNTAMDSARTARRMGADVVIVYRRSEQEMPARAEEVKHAKEEGIRFMTLHNPLEYDGDEKGNVTRMLLQVMELGEPDASGRRSPVPVEGKTVWVDVDQVIVSIGVSPNPIIPRSVDGLAVSRRGTIEVNEDMQSNIPTLFAGGDIVRGGATVILAMSDGRHAAKMMHEYLSSHD
ncbi:MAG: NADPH-dependent glutamate synthase, partial [Paludibacteraceae bacterium]|nr:NADPH-dependent glutamate synthase [Paludibacteraceae bacterium]